MFNNGGDNNRLRSSNDGGVRPKKLVRHDTETASEEVRKSLALEDCTTVNKALAQVVRELRYNPSRISTTLLQGVPCLKAKDAERTLHRQLAKYSVEAKTMALMIQAPALASQLEKNGVDKYHAADYALVKGNVMARSKGITQETVALKFLKSLNEVVGASTVHQRKLDMMEAALDAFLHGVVTGRNDGGGAMDIQTMIDWVDANNAAVCNLEPIIEVREIARGFVEAGDWEGLQATVAQIEANEPAGSMLTKFFTYSDVEAAITTGQTNSVVDVFLTNPMLVDRVVTTAEPAGMRRALEVQQHDLIWKIMKRACTDICGDDLAADPSQLTDDRMYEFFTSFANYLNTSTLNGLFLGLKQIMEVQLSRDDYFRNKTFAKAIESMGAGALRTLVRKAAEKAYEKKVDEAVRMLARAGSHLQAGNAAQFQQIVARVFSPIASCSAPAFMVNASKFIVRMADVLNTPAGQHEDIAEELGEMMERVPLASKLEGKGETHFKNLLTEFVRHIQAGEIALVEGFLQQGDVESAENAYNAMSDTFHFLDEKIQFDLGDRLSQMKAAAQAPAAGPVAVVRGAYRRQAAQPIQDGN
ncbi:unnamed protein product [Amoebophrya sp. A25]|nr:unnamed protein product [Amoebophrya sp. A25]|eukprot:GSA25T00004410001.1